MTSSSPEYVTIECPKCGPKTRSEVLATAYLGGWCIGTGRGKHKPASYKLIPPGAPVQTELN